MKTTFLILVSAIVAVSVARADETEKQELKQKAKSEKQELRQKAKSEKQELKQEAKSEKRELKQKARSEKQELKQTPKTDKQELGRWAQGEKQQTTDSGGGWTHNSRTSIKERYRAVAQIRDWHGPGEYGGRYFKKRPRYFYDGNWHVYGHGPLPYYLNYDKAYPVYSVIYAQPPILANWISVARWHGPGEYAGRYFKSRPKYFYGGNWYFYGHGPLPYYNNYDNANPVYNVAYTEPPINSDEANLNVRVQSVLAELNYFHGLIDGLFGADSQKALRAFQSDHNLASTGVIDDATLVSLNI